MAQFDWPPRPIPGIDAALRDVTSKKATFRRNAAIALGTAGQDRREEAIRALGRLIDDADREVRIEAVYAATTLAAAALAPRIREILSSEDPDLRAASLEFLGRQGDRSDAERISRLAEADQEPSTRCIAIEALAEMDQGACRAACRRVIGDSRSGEDETRTAIAALGPMAEGDDVAAITGLLGDPRRRVSIQAASALADIGDAAGIDVLWRASTNPPDDDARIAALEALCRIRDDRVDSLARSRHGRIFAGRDERLYWTGILARSGNADALRRLKEAATGRDTRLAALALRISGLCAMKDMIAILENAACGRAGEDLVTESIEALALTRRPEAVGALERVSAAASGGPHAGHAEAALEEARRWPAS